MEKSAFADTDAEPRWWLLQPELEYGTAELRKDIGEHLKWGREYHWYQEKWKVEELYDLIERHNSSLLQELDYATDDYKRQEWITRIVELTRPAPKTGTESTDSAVQHTESPMPPAEPALAQAASPAAKPSPFKKKSAAPSEAPAEPQAHLASAVKDVMSHLEPDKLPGLAGELGITEEELASIVRDLPADFEKLVAAEAAKLAGAA